jgi:hypothetical protein
MPPFAGRVFNACIVSRGDVFGSQFAGGVQQGCELDPLVAQNARVWGATGAVFRSERLDHIALELAGAVESDEPDTELPANRLNIGNAAFGLVPTGVGTPHTMGEDEVNANNIESLSEQQCCCDRGIDTPAHSNHDFRFCFQARNPLLSA